MTDIIPINIDLTARDQLNLVSFWDNILKESLARVHVDMLGAASDYIQVQREDHAVQLTYRRSVWRPRKRTPDVSIRDKNSYDQTYTIWADTSDATWTVMRFNLMVDGETVEEHTFYREKHLAKRLDTDLQALYEAMLEKADRSTEPSETSVKQENKKESKESKKEKVTFSPEMAEEIQALHEYLCLSGLVGLADPLSVALDKGSCKLATIGRGERFTAIYHGMVKEKDESIKKKIRWTIELNAYLEDGQWDWSALFVNRLTQTKETTLRVEEIEEPLPGGQVLTRCSLAKPEPHVGLEHASWHVEKHMAPVGIDFDHLLSTAVERHLAKKEAK